MAVAYAVAIGVLAALALWWPTVGGGAAVGGLIGMFAVVAVLDLVVRPLVLGSAGAGPLSRPTDLNKPEPPGTA
jgi:hypothetical protein